MLDEFSNRIQGWNWPEPAAWRGFGLTSKPEHSQFACAILRLTYETVKGLISLQFWQRRENDHIRDMTCHCDGFRPFADGRLSP